MWRRLNGMKNTTTQFNNAVNGIYTNPNIVASDFLRLNQQRMPYCCCLFFVDYGNYLSRSLHVECRLSSGFEIAFDRNPISNHRSVHHRMKTMRTVEVFSCFSDRFSIRYFVVLFYWNSVKISGIIVRFFLISQQLKTIEK